MFKDGDTIRVTKSDGAAFAGDAVWRDPGRAIWPESGFVGPCGAFYTPEYLKRRIEHWHEAALHDRMPNYLCMAEQLIAEGEL